jgi:hypothetical protein
MHAHRLARLHRYPGGSYKENWYSNRLYQLLFHYGPAHAVDLLCRLVGQKPFLVRSAGPAFPSYLQPVRRVSDMMIKSCKALEPFTTNSWTWSSTNTLTLEVCSTTS